MMIIITIVSKGNNHLYGRAHVIINVNNSQREIRLRRGQTHLGGVLGKEKNPTGQKKKKKPTKCLFNVSLFVQLLHEKLERYIDICQQRAFYFFYGELAEDITQK